MSEKFPSLALVPTSEEKYSGKDFKSDQEVRWCPGCGDYAVLKYLSEVLEEKGWKPHEVIVVSGIGCASRLPYYLSCYGFHTIHGRAPTIATGIALANPDLPLIVITGDGDACSIGLHHFIHAIRRNVNMTILLLNNRVYGLTKGQTSPTSPIGQKTKTDREGNSVAPLCPLMMTLSAGGSWAGRCIDVDGPLMKRLLHHALDHVGTSVLEVYQNCPVFNKYSFPSHKALTADGMPEYAFVWPDEEARWGEKHFDYLTGEWIDRSSPDVPRARSVIHAMSLLQSRVPVVGLFHQHTQAPFASRAKPCLQGYSRACQKLPSWQVGP